MIKVQDNKITISKGDNAVVRLRLMKNGLSFTLDTGDKLIFTANTPTPIVKELGSPTLVFLKADTANCAAGTYEYDIKIIFASGEKYYLIFPTHFIVRVCNITLAGR